MSGCLVIEDDDIKCFELASIAVRVLESVVTVAKSVNSGINCLREQKPSVVLLDMSLPAFDFSLDDGGFRHIVFGGRDVLDEIDRLGYDSKVVVVTAYDRFGDSVGSTTLEDLSLELRREYPKVFVDSVWYSPLTDAWETKLVDLLTALQAQGLGSYMIVAIIDDSDVKFNRIREVLTEDGSLKVEEVLRAEDISSARKLLAEHSVDLLVVDCVLPVASGEQPESDAGIDFLRELIDDRLDESPAQIVGITAFDFIATRLEAEFLAYSVPLLRYSEEDDGWRSSLRYAALRAARGRQAARSSGTGPTKVGIICALGEEMDAVLATPGSWSPWENADSSSIYWKGQLALSDNPTGFVAALSPRMGPCACAVSATKLIELCRPSFIATVGIMAGIRGKVGLGDVVLAEQCWDWSEGKWIYQQQRPVFLPSPHVLSTGPDVLAVARRVARDRDALRSVWDRWRGPKPAAPPNLFIGPVASGSAVVAAQDVTDRIGAAHRKLLGIEMEAYALHAAATDATLPRPVPIAVKAVSDFADHEKNDDWRAYASFTSVEIFLMIMRELLRGGTRQFVVTFGFRCAASKRVDGWQIRQARGLVREQSRKRLSGYASAAAQDPPAVAIPNSSSWREGVSP